MIKFSILLGILTPVTMMAVLLGYRHELEIHRELLTKVVDLKSQELKLIKNQELRIKNQGGKTSMNLDVSTWKTYRNEKYGFEVKYPPEWGMVKVEENRDHFWFKNFPCEPKGFTFVGSFSISSVNFEARSINFADCRDRGAGTADSHSIFEVKESKIIGKGPLLKDVIFPIIKTIFTMDRNPAYLFEDFWGNKIATIKLSHEELFALLFMGSQSDLENLLSTFKFTK